jgi:alpha-L-fucosidase
LPNKKLPHSMIPNVLRREARFGLFIHWGLYAIPAGTWEGSTGHGEDTHDGQNPVDRYEGFVHDFNPAR